MKMGMKHLSNSEFSFCLDVSLVNQAFVHSDCQEEMSFIEN